MIILPIEFIPAVAPPTITVPPAVPKQKKLYYKLF
jgi:hypothetical protein